MRTLGTIAAGLAGCLVFAVLMPFAASGLVHSDEKPVPLATVAEPGAVPAPVIETRQARTIEPARFAAPFAEGVDALERITPKTVEKKIAVRVAVLLLPRPVSLEVGLFRSGDRLVRLRDIQSLPPSALCDAPDGARWPCGMVALTRQRMFVRNRTIACDNAAAREEDVVLTSCRVGNADIGAWLVENGWADAAEGSPLQQAREAAHRSGKGLWGADPRQPAVPPRAIESGVERLHRRRHRIVCRAQTPCRARHALAMWSSRRGRKR